MNRTKMQKVSILQCIFQLPCYEFGCGFVVSGRLRHFVSGFTPVNERIATTRIKILQHQPYLCAHALTNKVKDAFYAEIEYVYDKCPAHDAKIVLGDFRAGRSMATLLDSLASTRTLLSML